MLKIKYALGLMATLTGLAYGNNKTYTVREGDTLSGIAKKLGVSQVDLVHTNRLTNPDALKPGMVLQIPASAMQPQLPTLLNKIKSHTDKSGASLPKTESPAVASSQPAAKPAAKVAGKSYTVKAGDNDWLIASRLGTTASKIRQANPGIDWNRLQIGTKLVLPAGAAAKAAVPQIRTRYAKINRDAVVVRGGPDTTAGKVTTAHSGQSVKVVARSSGWYKVKFSGGTVGWVRGDLLKEASAPAPAPTRVASKSNTTPKTASKKASTTRVASKRSAPTSKPKVVLDPPANAEGVLGTAYAMRGTRYRYGASSRSAVDCSGYTSLVYRQHGVSLPHSSRAQAGVGQKVSKSELKEGDLVFFKTNRGTRINHVGIYVGNGKFIHASSGGGKVQVNSLNDGYYQKRFAGARRVSSKK